MIIEKINSPSDLKNLTPNELDTLAGEIRAMILEVVSKKGGHLASSMGAVELIIALHHCLNTPSDSLIFDVGHQAYAHKILTGRRDTFGTLREYKGISGFPNFNESPYDVYITGHASTAVSCAQGIAEAKKIKKDTSKTVAVIGDGSLTGGMCFEALNHAGHSQSEILVIVNHNEMSISPSVGALSNYLTKIVSDPVYNRIKEELEKFIQHFAIMKKVSQKAGKFEEAVKGLLIPGMFFEELGFRYFGPIDGHDFSTLVPTLKNVLALKGPRVLHLITKKGRGFPYSEENSEDYHSAVPFDMKNGNPVKIHEEGFGEVFAKKLASLAEKDERVVAITAAMLKGTGLDLFQEKFPSRTFDVGIAEEHAVTFASGLAKMGLKPHVAVYSTFLQRAYDQIFHDVALQNVPVTFVLDRAGVVGEDGPTHHGVFDVAYLRHIPNLVCMAPKDKEELEDMLEFSLTLKTPVSIRYPKGGAYSLKKEKDPGKRAPIELGKAEILSQGNDVCILAMGSMVKTGVESVLALKEKKVDATLVNARFIKPLDETLLKELAARFSMIVTLEEAALAGGFGSAVLEFLSQENLLSKTRVIRLGFPDEFICSAKREHLMSLYGVDSQAVVTVILKELGSQRS